MRKLLYVTGRFLIHLYKRPIPAIASLLMMLLLFLMFNLVWISYLTVENYYEQALGDVDMELFLENNLPDSQLVPIADALKDLEGLEAFELISKDDARARLHALMGTDLLEGLDDNPLPKSYLINFDKQFITGAYLKDVEAGLRRLGGVDEIFYPRIWLENAESNRFLISRGVIVLGAVIFLAVILNLLYSVRLTVKNYDEELVQNRLLGAGKTFLSIPYIFEGIFYSISACVVSWLLIIYALEYFSFANFNILIPVQEDIIRSGAVAVIVGAIGGYIGVRRSL